MSAENFISITGNITRDPELKDLPSGQPVINFQIAQTPRQFDKNTNTWKDLETNFFRVSAFGDVARNAAASLARGSRVTVQGEFRTERYKAADANGQMVEKSSNNIRAEEISVSLRYATASVTRNAKKENGGGFNQYASQQDNGFGNGGNGGFAQGGNDQDAPF